MEGKHISTHLFFHMERKDSPDSEKGITRHHSHHSGGRAPRPHKASLKYHHQVQDDYSAQRYKPPRGTTPPLTPSEFTPVDTSRKKSEVNYRIDEETDIRLWSLYSQRAGGRGPKKVKPLSPLEPSPSTPHDGFILTSYKTNRFIPSKSDTLHVFSQVEISDYTTSLVIDISQYAVTPEPPSPTGPMYLPPPRDEPQAVHIRTFDWAQENSVEGMLLVNLERYSQFPFVMYFAVEMCDIRKCVGQIDSLTCHDSKIHHCDAYEEVASISRSDQSLKPSEKTGYIVSIFQVFPGEDSERLEKNWLVWTGAGITYRKLPQCLGLTRIAFYKKLYPTWGLTYVMLCECTQLQDNVTQACVFVDQLRARCCGFTGIYRAADNL